MKALQETQLSDVKLIFFLYVSFEAYAKNVREKAIKCFSKTTEVLVDADGHVLS